MITFPIGYAVRLRSGTPYEWHTYRINGVEVTIQVIVIPPEERSRLLRSHLEYACERLWGPGTLKTTDAYVGDYPPENWSPERLAWN